MWQDSRAAGARHKEHLQHVEILEIHLGSDDSGKVDGRGGQSSAEQGASEYCSCSLG